MGPEAAVEGLAELGELAAQSTFGHLRQDLWVGFAGHEGGDHGSAGHAQHVRSDDIELDAGVLEDLLDPRSLGGVVLDPSAAAPRSAPQPAIPATGERPGTAQVLCEVSPGGRSDAWVACRSSARRKRPSGGSELREAAPDARSCPDRFSTVPRRLRHAQGSDCRRLPWRVVEQGVQDPAGQDGDPSADFGTHCPGRLAWASGALRRGLCSRRCRRRRGWSHCCCRCRLCGPRS